MTSNIGAQYIDKMEQMGFGTKDSDVGKYEDVKSKVLEALKDYFRPEFLNRVDDIVVFDVLSKEAIGEIVKIQVDVVKKRLEEKEINLQILPEVYEYLSKEGYNPQYGARPLKRLIQDKILSPVASLIISKSVVKGGSVVVSLKDGKFEFDVKKGRGGALIESNILDTRVGVE